MWTGNSSLAAAEFLVQEPSAVPRVQEWSGLNGKVAAGVGEWIRAPKLNSKNYSIGTEKLENSTRRNFGKKRVDPLAAVAEVANAPALRYTERGG
jgi:hypothetical protein